MLRPVRSAIAAISADDTRDDEVAGSHADGAGDEDGFAAEFVDVQHGGDGEEEFEDADDPGGEEGDGAAGEAEVLEDEGGVVVYCLWFKVSVVEYVKTRKDLRSHRSIAGRSWLGRRPLCV